MQGLVDRIRQQFPAITWSWLGEGVARVADYQDAAYANQYLDDVLRVLAHDDSRHGYALTIEAARWLAVAMSYDDVIRVADLKTRAERFERLAQEIGTNSWREVHGSEEYFHPRLEEVMGLLPDALARRLQSQPRLMAWLAVRLDKGRRIHTHTLWGHAQLRLIASLRRWRRSNHRHQHESRHWQDWLNLACECAARNTLLAVQVLRCRRLIKGYSDTHSRGQGKYDQLMAQVPRLLDDPQGAQLLQTWLRLALAQVETQALVKAIAQDERRW